MAQNLPASRAMTARNRRLYEPDKKLDGRIELYEGDRSVTGKKKNLEPSNPCWSTRGRRIRKSITPSIQQ